MSLFVVPLYFWLKQKCPFTFMEPKVKYICIYRPHTSNSCLFIVCLFHKFVEIQVCPSLILV